MKPDDGIVSSSLQPVRPIPMMKTNVTERDNRKAGKMMAKKQKFFIAGTVLYF